MAGDDTLWRRPNHPYRRHPMYEPRIDVAVGPFAIEGRYGDDYDALVSRYRPQLRRIYEAHSANVAAHRSRFPPASLDSVLHRNHNARCLLAIEVERANGAAKYLMGTAFNAVALGRVGIIVCWETERLHDFLGLREYLCFLAAVDKNTFSVDNLLIVSRDQIEDVLWGPAPFDIPR